MKAFQLGQEINAIVKKGSHRMKPKINIRNLKLNQKINDSIFSVRLLFRVDVDVLRCEELL